MNKLYITLPGDQRLVYTQLSMKTTNTGTKQAVWKTLLIWNFITLLILAQCTWIYVRHGLNGFQAYMQDSPLTFTPFELASAGLVWLLCGLFLWLIHADRIKQTNLFSWAGFFLVITLYLNILRERLRYGDIGYYTEAAFSIFNYKPLPDTYLYPPLWATLLSLLTPLGEDGILIICWLANILSLCVFYYLLHRILEHYQFQANTAALVTTLFMLVNMPIMRTLMYVQVNLHVINFIFLAILLYRNHPFLSAFALALAVHFKASPALLVLAFLLEFNWKWLVYFTLSMIGISLFTVALYGWNPFFEFVTNIKLLNVGRPFSLHDGSFDSAISVTLSYLRVNAQVTWLWVYLFKGLTVLLAIILGLRATSLYPREMDGARLHNAIGPFLLAMTIASPLIWEHHAVFLSLPFLLLLKKVESPAEWIWFGAAYLFVFLMPTYDFFPWSYTKLFGILVILGLLWSTQKRENNTFINTPWNVLSSH
jgi:hypothetical protein